MIPSDWNFQAENGIDEEEIDKLLLLLLFSNDDYNNDIPINGQKLAHSSCAHLCVYFDFSVHKAMWSQWYAVYIWNSPSLVTYGLTRNNDLLTTTIKNHCRWIIFLGLISGRFFHLFYTNILIWPSAEQQFTRQFMGWITTTVKVWLAQFTCS